MIKKTVAVLGSTGMAGLVSSQFFKHKGYSVRDFSRKVFDVGVDSFTKLANALMGSDIIINCIGVIKPMMKTIPIETVLKVNAVFPRNLATFGRVQGIPVFHLTTDCVYSGLTGSYDENSFYDAEDAYGLSKNAGDISECMTLRTSIIGEERGQSRSLVEWAKSQAGKPVKGFTNHFWNGITTLRFAQIVERIVDKGLYKPGIFHVHSPDTVTKSELLKIFDELYSLNLKIEEVPGPEFCDRSLKSLHPLVKQLEIPTIKEQVLEMRDFFKSQF